MLEQENQIVGNFGEASEVFADFGRVIYTLGVEYHPAVEACLQGNIVDIAANNEGSERDFFDIIADNVSSKNKNIDKAAKLQDFGYHIKGELLKQYYSPLHSSYKKSTLCGSEIEVTLANGTKIKINYLCRQKWCPRCNRIRSAELINIYAPIISSWEDLYMVTLTVQNVNALDLKDKLTEMQQRFRNIMRTIHRRLGTSAIRAIKTIEVTANIETKTVHPHYHNLIESKEAALLLRELWMERSKQDGDVVVWAAQDVTKVESPEEAAKEMFKYLTKFLVKTEGKMGFDGWLLDKIYVGTYRKHLIQTFGFEKPKEEAESEAEEQVAVEDAGNPKTESFAATWVPEINQYVVRATGEIISSHKRSKTFQRILSIIKGEEPPRTS